MESKQQYNKQRKPRRRARRAPLGFGPQTGKNAGSPSTGTTAYASLAVRNLPLFPYRTKRTLVYYSAGTVSSGASTAGAYVFSANGLFDPDISGTGGQPMGFDQMMLFYNHYTVVKARIKAIITASSTTNTTTTAILLSGSSSATTVIEQLVENGNLVLSQLGYAGQMGSTTTITQSVLLSQFQGVDDVMDDPNMRGDSASNPAEQAYFHVVVYNPYSSTVVPIFFQAVIEYDAVFHEPRKGPLS